MNEREQQQVDAEFDRMRELTLIQAQGLIELLELTPRWEDEDGETEGMEGAP